MKYLIGCTYMAAKENQLEEHEYAGGLVHGETKIQEGVALDMRKYHEINISYPCFSNYVCWVY